MAYPAYWHNEAWEQAWFDLDPQADYNAYSVGVPPGDLDIAPIWYSADFHSSRSKSDCRLVKDENDIFYYVCVENDIGGEPHLYFQRFKDDESEPIDETFEITVPSGIYSLVKTYGISPCVGIRKRSETLFDIVFFAPSGLSPAINGLQIYQYTYVLGQSSATLFAEQHFNDSGSFSDHSYSEWKCSALTGEYLSVIWFYPGTPSTDYEGYVHSVMYSLESGGYTEDTLFNWRDTKNYFIDTGGFVVGPTRDYDVSTGFTGAGIYTFILYGGPTVTGECPGALEGQFFYPTEEGELWYSVAYFSSGGKNGATVLKDQAFLYRSGFSGISLTDVIAIDPSVGAIFSYGYTKRESSMQCRPFHVPLYDAETITTHSGTIIVNGPGGTFSSGETFGVGYLRGYWGVTLPDISETITSIGQINDTDPPLLVSRKYWPSGHEGDLTPHYDFHFITLDGVEYAEIGGQVYNYLCPTGFMGKWPITHLTDAYSITDGNGYAIWGSPFIVSEQGIYVQTVELDTSGSISDSPIQALGLGEPEFGDRAAWNIFEYPTIHAQDISLDHQHYHSPIPDDLEQTPVWNGTKWVPGYVFSPGGHDWEDHWHLEEDVTDLLHDATHIRSVLVIDNPTADEYLMYEGTSGSYISDPMASEKEVLGTKMIGFISSGSLAGTGAIPTRILSPWNGTTRKVTVSANDPPGGANLIVDVNQNGTTIFTDQNNRPVILAGEYSGETEDIDINSVSLNDVFTADLDQIGTSGSPGSDIRIMIVIDT